MQKHIQQTTGRASTRQRPAWMIDQVLEKIAQKSQAYKKFLTTRESKDYKIYTREKNQANWTCNKALKTLTKPLPITTTEPGNV